MPKFGKRSKERLSTIHPKLQKLFNEVIKYYDCSVICGHRTKEEQDKAYPKYSKVKFPNSKHNTLPSVAADVVPYPIDWDDYARFKEFGFFVLGVAAGMGIKITWGADWNKNYDVDDEKFKDFPHFQLDKSELGGE